MNTLHEERVLVLTAPGRDGALAVGMLEHHGIHAELCRSIDEIVGGITNAGCAIVVAEKLSEPMRARLLEALAAQPPWSDFPFILFAPGGERGREALEASKVLGNVSLLERPVQIRTLVSAVSAALRGRRRQYEARAAIRSRDQFLAMLGHELRNPLAAIILALDMLQAMSSDAGEKQRAIIDRQSRHLARLVDDLLDVARVTSGKITLRRERVDLVEVVRRCISGAELAARTRSIALCTSAPSTSLFVEGDLVRLEEVFNNLINNAIKYSPDHARIDITVRPDGADHIVEVADTGIGMSPEVVERVFELFSQAETSLARSQGGLGIGLTLVRALVELHGGRIEAHSEGLDRGSQFLVRLPAAHAESRRVPAPPAPTSRRASTSRSS